MNHRILLAVLASTSIASAQIVIGSFPLTTTNGAPVGLDHDLAGALLFTDIGSTNQAGTCDANTGALLTNVALSPNTINAIGITRDGSNIYITDTGGRDVDVYDTSLNFVRSIPIAVQTTFPEGIAWRGANNHLYVIDGVVSAAHEYDITGAFVATYPLQGTSVDGAAWDPASDTFWVYDSGTDTVRNYDPSFNQIGSFPGTNAAGFGAGEGVAVIGGLLYVCATGSDTVVIFDISGSAAQNTIYGTGCPDEPGLFYELFAGSFDLANTAFRLTPLGTGAYAVATSPATIDPGFVNNLQLGDDTLSAGQQLGFTIPTVAGLQSTIDVDSNGRCGWGLTRSDYTESVAEFIDPAEGIILAPLWDDLNPSSAGGVYFDQLANYSMVTWDNVPQFGASDSNTVQVRFYPSGDIEIVYGVVGTTDCLVGQSDGSGFDPGNTDLSASFPFVTGIGATPVNITVDARPILGTTINIGASNLPGDATVGALLAGFSQTSVDLTPISMDGCTLYTSAEVTFAGFSGPSPSVPVLVLNDPALTGVSMYWQAAVLSVSSNALGVVMSDALDTRFGN